MDIAVIVTVLGLILTGLNIIDKMYTAKERISDKSQKEALTQSDVSAIRSGNASILVAVDKIDAKIDNHAERITRVEERVVDHKARLDKLETKV